MCFRSPSQTLSRRFQAGLWFTRAKNGLNTERLSIWLSISTTWRCLTNSFIFNPAKIYTPSLLFHLNYSLSIFPEYGSSNSFKLFRHDIQVEIRGFQQSGRLVRNWFVASPARFNGWRYFAHSIRDQPWTRNKNISAPEGEAKEHAATIAVLDHPWMEVIGCEMKLTLSPLFYNVDDFG